jgi:diguanylate cyclase (GGDEF)-like protein
MTDDVRARFKGLGNFPSPPGIAQEIIALAKDPDADITIVARTIAKDPALATKVLRAANSPLYAQRRRSENLRQALLVIGVEATLTMCLSFSIAGAFRKSKVGTIDFVRYWRRSLLAALGSRCFGVELGIDDPDDLFLAGVLQDIGVVALDRAQPGFYADLAAGATHAQRIEFECQRLGEDHAALGAWLLASWNLPERLCSAVEHSHAPAAVRGADDRTFASCVALGGELATQFLADDRRAGMRELSERAQALLGVQPELVARVIEKVTQLTAEVGPLFDATLLSAEDVVGLMEEAQELLSERNVEALKEISTLQQAAQSLVARSEQLVDASRHDALTGVFNRGYLEECVKGELEAARNGGWPLSALFVDLDHFKRVNDTFGHAAGDIVLRGSAAAMRAALRDQDIIARYGGEEFVILLPGVDGATAQRLGERVRSSLRSHVHQCSGQNIVVTASFGLAVSSPSRAFQTATELLAAADDAAYAAKRAGRDCLVVSGAAGGAQLCKAS